MSEILGYTPRDYAVSVARRLVGADAAQDLKEKGVNNKPVRIAGGIFQVAVPTFTNILRVEKHSLTRKDGSPLYNIYTLASLTEFGVNLGSALLAIHGSYETALAIKGGYNATVASLPEVAGIIGRKLKGHSKPRE